MQLSLYQSFANMSLKQYRLPKRIGPNELVRQTLHLTSIFKETERIYNEKIRVLNKLYTDKWCPRKVGDVLPLPPGAKEGYDTFTIIDRYAVITRDKTSQYPEEYTIHFDYFGTFSGPDVEPFNGHLKTKPTNDQTQDPQA